jgi:hypothetical protein
MMTFKPKLRVTLGFMCLECSRTFYAVTRRSWMRLTTSGKMEYIVEEWSIFLIFSIESLSVLFIHCWWWWWCSSDL